MNSYDFFKFGDSLWIKMNKLSVLIFKYSLNIKPHQNNSPISGPRRRSDMKNRKQRLRLKKVAKVKVKKRLTENKG